jgi:GH24 family phage-related lysozyme (muramidase)
MAGSERGILGGEKALKEIRLREGFAAKAYKDASGYSIGYGHFIDQRSEPDLMHRVLTKNEAEDLLKTDIYEHQSSIRKNLKVELSDERLATLTSVAYNLGPNSKGLLQTIDLINQGREEEIPGVLGQYVKSKNPTTHVLEVNPVLVKRRAAEAEALVKGRTEGPRVARKSEAPEGRRTTPFEANAKQEVSDYLKPKREAANTVEQFIDQQIASAAQDTKDRSSLYAENERILKELMIQDDKMRATRSAHANDMTKWVFAKKNTWRIGS